MTGSVKLNPSSAISGGGGGTGSDRCIMASAALSKTGSPDPFTMVADTTWPRRSSTKLTRISTFSGVFRRIALVLVEMSHQFLLPGGQDSARAFAGALLRRDRTLRFLGILNARHRRRFRGRQFLRGRRLLRSLFGVVIHRLFQVGLGDDTVRLGGLRRRVLGQIGFLLDRLLLGKRGRGDGCVGVRPGRKVGRLTMRRGQIESNLDRRRAEIIGRLSVCM